MSKHWILGAVAACALAGTTTAADACINGVEHALSPKTIAVAKAERRLDKGDAKTAIDAVLRVYPKLKGTSVKRGRQSQAQRVLALALVRIDGNYDGGGFRADEPEQRLQNVRWATHLLRVLAKARVASEADLAEALAHDPETQGEALEKLSELEREDRLGSHQLGALAQLRRKLAADEPSWLRAPKRALETTSAVLAEGRCLRMSNDEQRCLGPKASDAS